MKVEKSSEVITQVITLLNQLVYNLNNHKRLSAADKPMLIAHVDDNQIVPVSTASPDAPAADTIRRVVLSHLDAENSKIINDLKKLGIEFAEPIQKETLN